MTRMIDTHMGVAIFVESTAEALRAGKKMCCRMLITAVTTARLLTVVVRSTHVSHGHTKVGMDVSGGWLPVATGDGLKHRGLGGGCPSS